MKQDAEIQHTYLRMELSPSSEAANCAARNRILLLANNFEFTERFIMKLSVQIQQITYLLNRNVNKV
jgi:hypothetical protein